MNDRTNYKELRNILKEVVDRGITVSKEHIYLLADSMMGKYLVYDGVCDKDDISFEDFDDAFIEFFMQVGVVEKNNKELLDDLDA